jgi:hypothetical protein
MGDWNSSVYITSQVFVCLAYILLFATYQIKGRSLMLGTTITSNILMGTGFILLGAWTGLAMCAVAICRDVVSEIFNRKRSEKDRTKILPIDWLLLALWVILLVGLTMFTESGWITWFALFATLTFTISIWQKNVLFYKVCGILVGIFWIIYNFGAENLFGIILESILLVGVIIGLTRFIIKHKKFDSELETL